MIKNNKFNRILFSSEELLWTNFMSTPPRMTLLVSVKQTLNKFSLPQGRIETQNGYLKILSLLKQYLSALASVALLVGASSCNQNVAGSILGQGTCLGCRFDPRSRCKSAQSPVWTCDRWVRYVRHAARLCFSLAFMSLSVPFSLPSSL